MHCVRSIQGRSPRRAPGSPGRGLCQGWGAWVGRSTLAAVLLAAANLAGCRSGTECQTVSLGSSAPRPARISHWVLIKLNDPADADAMIADADRLLSSIPGVTAYAAGKHIDTGRPTVVTDYDVALYIGFETTEGYATYVEHPRHVEAVNMWRDRMTWLRVWDMLDETP